MKEQLFKAAHSGNISLFRAALRTVEINEVNEHGETALMVACKLGHAELAKFILSRGADEDLTDSNGNSVLDLVVSANNPEIISLFIKPKIKSLSESQVLGKCLVSLAESISPALLEVDSLIERLDERLRLIFMLDLKHITYYLRKQQEFSLLDGFAFVLLALYLKSKVEFAELIVKIKTDTHEGVVQLASNLHDSMTQPIQSFSETNFALELLPHLVATDANKVRKFYYEYSELLVKADGTVSKLESNGLKYLAKKLFDTHIEEANANDHLNQTSLDSILSELNNLVGLENIKNDIKSLINVIKVNQLRKKEGLPEQKLNMHSVFIGPPGTGKTTIARMMVDIYFELNVLNENNFVEVDRSGMVAGYVGQTAIKTNEVIEKALNGVLFIDEAYTLARKNSEDDFGQEAIDILLKKMEDSRDKLIVIVAGYEEEMMTFINSNPGLSSRFNRFFHFRDYVPIQLSEIFRKTACAAGFALTEDATNKVASMFDILYKQRGNRFGNARLVRNVFEKTFEKHANRTASIAPISRKILTTILVDDVPYDEFIK